MSFLDTKSPLILLYRDLEALPDIPRYDIMLSPQFYILKREELPVKYPFQAKKLAPSVLDELSDDESMTYEVFRENEEWVFVAYSLRKLAEFLDIKGGSIDKVGHIYFAEQAKDKLSNPIELNDREALMLVNNKATIVPKQLLPENTQLSEFDTSFRPERSFRAQRSYNSYIDTKQAVILASLLGVLGVGYIAEGYRYHRAIKTENAKLEKILEENPSLSGAYARESIHKKYITIDKEQRAIRDRIKATSRMTSKKTKINSLSVNTKGYKVTLDIPSDPKTVKSLRTIAQNGDFKHLSIKGNKLESEGEFQ